MVTISQMDMQVDVVTASDNYASRFAGPAGQWMLSVQEEITLSLLEDMQPEKILDVGGGHGQLALPLCEKGYRMTVTGSSESCKERIRSVIESRKCDFDVVDIYHLPYADNSFDVVLCFRMMMHVDDWQALAGELCRVARKCVIIDYPTVESVNVFSPLMFRLKKKFEHNTRPWRLFRHAEIREIFEANGFDAKKRVGQFFLPMVLHRMLQCLPISRALEGFCRSIGLTWLLGSPVIAKMVKPDI